MRLFINGEEVVFSGTQPAQNRVYQFNTNQIHEVGDSYENGAFEGYLAQSFMIGSKSIQQGDFAITDFLDTFTFGTNGSQFIPKKHSEIKTLVDSGSDNSFLLQYENSSALGTDSSTNTNTFTPTSMSAANQSTHTPSLQFPVLNALNGDATLVGSLGYGNRLAVGVSDWDSVFATKSMGSSGKYYYEVRMHTETGSNGFIAGIHEESSTSKNWANYIGNTTSTYGLGYALYTAGDSNSYYTNGSGCKS